MQVEGRLLLLLGPITRKRSGDAVSWNLSPFLLRSDRSIGGRGWAQRGEGSWSFHFPTTPLLHPQQASIQACFLCLVGSWEPWILSQIQLVRTLHLVLLHMIKDAGISLMVQRLSLPIPM